MSTTDWEKLQALAAQLRSMASALDRHMEYDPKTARLIQAIGAIADLAASADTMPTSLRLSALLELIEEESKRLS